MRTMYFAMLMSNSPSFLDSRVALSNPRHDFAFVFLPSRMAAKSNNIASYRALRRQKHVQKLETPETTRW